MDTKKILSPIIGQIEISVYNNGFDAKSRQYLRMQEIVDIIVSGRPLLSNPNHSIKDLQTTARYKKAELPHSQYQEWKAENLPMFLVTGCFSERKTTGLLGPHTALINVDIDHIENVEELKTTIINNEPSLVMAGISPGGDGIKLIFYIAPTPTDATEHKQIATQLHEYLAKKYNIPLIDKDNTTGIDLNGNKLTFTCFFFHDPNLYVNTKVPSRFQGNLNKLVNSTKENYDEFDWEKLNSCLKHYTADCNRDDWISIGIALKHEGQKRKQEDLFFKRWDEWSSESSKYNSNETKYQWESLNKDNTTQLTLGTIYDKAKKDGWVPPVLNLTKKTEQNRDRLAQKTFEEYQLENTAIPLHIRSTPAEDADMARMVHYAPDHFLIVDNKDVYIKTLQGSWDKIEIEQSNGSIDNVLNQTREKSLTEAEEHILGGPTYKMNLHKSFRSTNSHIKALTGRLLALPGRADHTLQRIRLKDFNNRIIHNPTLPTEFGAIDLCTGEKLTSEQYAKYHALESKEWAVEYDPDILNKKSHGCQVAKHLIENHYGIELMSRLAYHLVYSSKSVDIINIPTSSAGKTALVKWLKETLGLVGLDSRSRSLTAKGDAYTQATAPLTEHLLYFYDEVDKLNDEIPTGVLNEMTSEDLTISKKYQNPTPLPRMGTGILIGADWPPIDATAQGLDTRITYVCKLDIQPMSEAVKRTLQNDTDSHKYLLAWLVRECMKWTKSQLTWQNSLEADKAREQFFRDRTPEVKQLLLEAYTQTNSPNNYVPTNTVKESLSICTEKYNLLKAVTSTFPKVKRIRKRITTKDGSINTYVFTNLAEKIEENKTAKDIEDTLNPVAKEDIENVLEQSSLT